MTMPHEPPASRPFSRARAQSQWRRASMPCRTREGVIPTSEQPARCRAAASAGVSAAVATTTGTTTITPDAGRATTKLTRDDYDEEAPTGAGAAASSSLSPLLGLAVLGTAGAFAYRAMFGGSMLPSLPPIIKADDGPNKIVPNSSKSQQPASRCKRQVGREGGDRARSSRSISSAGESDSAGASTIDFRSNSGRPADPALRAALASATASRRRRRHRTGHASTRRRTGGAWPPAQAPRPHPLAARRRLGQARRQRRRKSTRSSSGPIRSGRRPPMLDRAGAAAVRRHRRPFGPRRLRAAMQQARPAPHRRRGQCPAVDRPQQGGAAPAPARDPHRTGASASEPIRRRPTGAIGRQRRLCGAGLVAAQRS